MNDKILEMNSYFYTLMFTYDNDNGKRYLALTANGMFFASSTPEGAIDNLYQSYLQSQQLKTRPTEEFEKVFVCPNCERRYDSWDKCMSHIKSNCEE